MNLSETQARDEICRIGQSLFNRGYVHATAGNISIRLNNGEDGYLMTPTDACLGFLEPTQLSKIDKAGQQLSGLPASKTMALHRAIYQATHSIQPAHCVIHTHSTYCVALTLQANQIDTSNTNELLPAVTPYFVMKVGRVPVMPYRRPGDPNTASDVAAAIAHYAALGRRISAVMLSRLGPNVWHQSPASAMAVLEELEETAKLWLLSNPKPAPLDEAKIQALRETFNVQW